MCVKLQCPVPKQPNTGNHLFMCSNPASVALGQCFRSRLFSLVKLPKPARHALPKCSLYESSSLVSVVHLLRVARSVITHHLFRPYIKHHCDSFANSSALWHGSPSTAAQELNSHSIAESSRYLSICNRLKHVPENCSRDSMPAQLTMIINMVMRKRKLLQEGEFPHQILKRNRLHCAAVPQMHAQNIWTPTSKHREIAICCRWTPASYFVQCQKHYIKCGSDQD